MKPLLLPYKVKSPPRQILPMRHVQAVNMLPMCSGRVPAVFRAHDARHVARATSHARRAQVALTRTNTPECAAYACRPTPLSTDAHDARTGTRNRAAPARGAPAQARFEHRNDLGGAVSTLGRRNLLEVLSKGEEDLDPLGHGHLHRSVRVQMAKTVLIVNCRIIRNANLQATCDL